jgi:FkbM family methyltransferase
MPAHAVSARIAGFERRARRMALEAGLRHETPEIASEVRQLMSVAARRDARDRHAMRVLIATALGANDSAIDVGAHSGAVLAEVVRVAPGGRHIAYEPLPAFADVLRRRFPQVEVREAALSDQNGKSRFVHVADAPEYSGLKERTYPGYENSPRHELEVRIERLDDVLPEDFRPALIKIDVEGAELQVMRGATDTLRRHLPIVVFEHGIGASDRYGSRPEDVHELLVSDLGMRIFDLDGEGPYTRDKFVDVFPAPIWNFVALRR